MSPSQRTAQTQQSSDKYRVCSMPMINRRAFNSSRPLCSFSLLSVRSGSASTSSSSSHSPPLSFDALASAFKSRMATISLIARLAHSPISQHLAILQAQLKSAEPLDFALVTPNGSLLGLIMRVLRATYIGLIPQLIRVKYKAACHSISGADFESLRSSLLSKLESFAPGPDSDVSTMLHLWLNPPGALLDRSVQPLVDDVIPVLLAKGADPLAADAEGNSTLDHLVQAGDYAQLIKLLDISATWKSCIVESGGEEGADPPHSEMNQLLHQVLKPGWRSLIDETIVALLAKGADPLATDADGNNALFLLSKSGDYDRLIKLLSETAPWKSCGIETAAFHRNVAGQTARTFVEARHSPGNRSVDALVVLALIEGMESFWAQRVKPTLIHTLTHDLGMAKDAAILCAQYIDGSGSGVSGKSAEIGEERKEADAAAAQ